MGTGETKFPQSENVVEENFDIDRLSHKKTYSPQQIPENLRAF